MIGGQLVIAPHSHQQGASPPVRRQNLHQPTTTSIHFCAKLTSSICFVCVCVCVPGADCLSRVVDAFEDQGKRSLLAGGRKKKQKKHISHALFPSSRGQCGTVGAHQLLGHLLHQGGKADVVIFPVVIHVLDQLWYGLGVSVRLKLIAFALLRREGSKE